MCGAVSTVEGVDVNESGGSFRLPKSNYEKSIVYHPTLRLWAVPVLAAKLSSRGKYTVFPPFSLGVTSYLSPANVWLLSSKDEIEMRL